MVDVGSMWWGLILWHVCCALPIIMCVCSNCACTTNGRAALHFLNNVIGISCCHLLFSVRWSNFNIKPMILVNKFWDLSKKSQNLGRNQTHNLHNSDGILYHTPREVENYMKCPWKCCSFHKNMHESCVMTISWRPFNGTENHLF